MSDRDMDKVEKTAEKPDQHIETRRERLEMQFTEAAEKRKVKQALTEGEQLEQRINQSIRKGDYYFKHLGIKEAPTDRIAVAKPFKKLTPSDRDRVMQELKIIKNIQEMRHRGLTEKEIAKMGTEYKNLYRRYFQPHVSNIRVIEYEGAYLVTNGKHHAAYASEAGLDEIPVHSERLISAREAKLQKEYEENLARAPFYKDHSSRLAQLKRFDSTIGDADGYVETRQNTFSENKNLAAGHFKELARAYRAHQAGLHVEALDKKVKTRQGETDIDILLRTHKGHRIWIENKDHSYTIANTEKFREKIDKMAAGRRFGAETMDGKPIKVDRVLFIAEGHISKEAMDYARNRQVEIQQNMKADRKFQNYITKVAKELDSS
ncbi:MAG: hypothetical protein Q9P90_08190 [candidate division KSB1 bacterium]|nr:hypothetical protein [candidate division KSB1 bacterium]